jgi:hypothetical protein
MEKVSLMIITMNNNNVLKLKIMKQKKNTIIKKTVVMIMLAALFANCTGARNNNNEPERDVLFTLGKHEKIAYGEYFVLQQMNGNRFACIVEDTTKNTRTFIFNGKRIVTTDSGAFDVLYVNVHEENGYVVEYCLQDRGYVNIKGKVYGPLDKGSLVFAYDRKGNTGYDKFYYCKTEGENTGYYIHDDGAKDGPFDRILFHYEAIDVADCEYLYQFAGKWYAHYSDGENKITPLVDEVRFKNWRDYVNINDTEYDEVWHSYFFESNKFAYIYRADEKYYVNINGTESREYDNAMSLQFTENGKYAYLYEENGECHININGTERSGYGDVVDLKITDDGGYSFCYRKEDGRIYKNNNGKETETDYLSGMEYDYKLAFFTNARRYDDNGLKIYSPDKEHSFDSSYEHAHVVIDGRTHGHAPALYAWYDAEKNAFVWNAVEGKELVVYEYKLD